MIGKIIKGIAGFYYVRVTGSGIYECRARGLFRKEKIKPMIGDNVEIEALSEEPKEGNVTEILPRRNSLYRPAVANVDAGLVIFAAAKPAANLNLLDRFLVMMEKQGIETAVCFNKADLAPEQAAEYAGIYRKAGYSAFLTDAKRETGLSEILAFLRGKTVTVAGPSGVGKSTMINHLQPQAGMETGSISAKIDRGKHTTRHSELIRVEEDTYIMDTPGFTSLLLEDMRPEELKEYFPEFREEEGKCRFRGCAHLKEPDCAVKAALAAGRISESRYENYKEIYASLKARKPF